MKGHLVSNPSEVTFFGLSEASSLVGFEGCLSAR